MKTRKARFVIEILEVNGFVVFRQKGSHIIYKKDDSLVIVPYHGSNKEIPIGTFLSIVKQSKLPKNLFE